MLMNGIGITGNLKRLKEFFLKAKRMLNHGGQIIFDSSDIDYLYHEPDGSKLINLNSNYYGELIFKIGNLLQFGHAGQASVGHHPLVNIRDIGF